MTESYEQLRDSVENSEARAAWLDRDRRLSAFTETYRTLGDDPRFTEGHKASQMWAAYDRESAYRPQEIRPVSSWRGKPRATR